MELFELYPAPKLPKLWRVWH